MDVDGFIKLLVFYNKIYLYLLLYNKQWNLIRENWWNQLISDGYKKNNT